MGMLRGGKHVALFGPSPPGVLGGGEFLGFDTDLPGPRVVDRKAKAKARAHRKAVKRQKARDGR